MLYCSFFTKILFSKLSFTYNCHIQQFITYTSASCQKLTLRPKLS